VRIHLTRTAVRWSATSWRRSARLFLFAAAAVLFIVAPGKDAAAQFVPPPPPPVTPASSAAMGLAAQSSLSDVGTQFLQRLGAVSSFKTAASAVNNPQGGGAEALAQRYRTWLEGYGLWSRTDARDDFAGDHRRTYGGVAGVGVTVTPGVTLGVSVDQSRTKIDIVGGAQNGRIDLTQVGAIAAFENGPWNLGMTLVHGFGDVHTSRFDVGGTSSASYFARLWGAMAELSYYHALPDNWRFVPKLTFDWVRARTDSFVEIGGTTPIAGNGVTSSRIRLLVGGEIGHSWLFDRTIMDFAMYGRLVDNLSQEIGTLTVSDPSGVATARSILGIRESNLGGDAGATLSAKLSELARLYAAYDGRFRGNFTSHTGTIGAELRF
jgi:uncharacterized protein with beta-barrel porin domain